MDEDISRNEEPGRTQAECRKVIWDPPGPHVRAEPSKRGFKRDAMYCVVFFRHPQRCTGFPWALFFFAQADRIRHASEPALMTTTRRRELAGGRCLRSVSTPVLTLGLERIG